MHRACTMCFYVVSNNINCTTTITTVTKIHQIVNHNVWLLCVVWVMTEKQPSVVSAAKNWTLLRKHHRKLLPTGSLGNIDLELERERTRHCGKPYELCKCSPIAALTSWHIGQHTHDSSTYNWDNASSSGCCSDGVRLNIWHCLLIYIYIYVCISICICLCVCICYQYIPERYSIMYKHCVQSAYIWRNKCTQPTLAHVLPVRFYYIDGWKRVLACHAAV